MCVPLLSLFVSAPQLPLSSLYSATAFHYPFFLLLLPHSPSLVCLVQKPQHKALETKQMTVGVAPPFAWGINPSLIIKISDTWPLLLHHRPDLHSPQA